MSFKSYFEEKEKLNENFKIKDNSRKIVLGIVKEIAQEIGLKNYKINILKAYFWNIKFKNNLTLLIKGQIPDVDFGTGYVVGFNNTGNDFEFDFLPKKIKTFKGIKNNMDLLLNASNTNKYDYMEFLETKSNLHMDKFTKKYIAKAPKDKKERFVDQTWEGGVFKGGKMSHCTFEDGVFEGELFQGGIFKNGVFKKGVFLNGIWRDGIWEGKGEWRWGDWYNGTWKDGVFKDGYFYNGTFKNGIFKGLIFYDGIFENGIFEGVTWENGIFKNGIFKSENWKNGTFENGTFEGVFWYDGVFKNGLIKNAEWHDGVFEDGIFDGGMWYDGNFKGGTWKGHSFYEGTFHNGIWESGEWLKRGKWIKGDIFSKKYNKYITSLKNPTEFYKLEENSNTIDDLKKAVKKK